MEGDSPPLIEKNDGLRMDNLLDQVRQGDETAARSLVEALYPTVVRIVRAHLWNRSDEEDIMQEIFMKMFAKMSQFRGAQPFEHWVGRIAVNTCHDRYRSRKARPVTYFSELNSSDADLVDLLLAGDPEATEERPEDAVEILEILLATLNEREQTIIRLLDLEQKSVKEIASITGWGESKIKVTAMRARRKLAEQLQQLEKGVCS